MTFLRVLRWELYKLAKRRASYLGFGLCVLFSLVVMLGFAYTSWRGLRHHGGAIALQYVNGYFFANFVLQIGFVSLLPLLATVIAGSQIAGEARDGTLRALLVRPPSRTTYFGAKAAASLLWLQVMVLFLIAFALVFGLIAMGGGDFMVYVWEYRRMGPWFAGGHDWIWIFLVSGAGATMALFMLGSLALMVSSFTDNPVVAHVTTLGVFFISSIVQRLPDEVIDPGFKDMMPTKHMSYWHELQHLFHPDPSRLDVGRLWNDFAWCSGYTLLFLAVGLIVFARRDVTA